MGYILLRDQCLLSLSLVMCMSRACMLLCEQDMLPLCNIPTAILVCCNTPVLYCHTCACGAYQHALTNQQSNCANLSSTSNNATALLAQVAAACQAIQWCLQCATYLTCDASHLHLVWQQAKLLSWATSTREFNVMWLATKLLTLVQQSNGI